MKFSLLPDRVIKPSINLWCMWIGFDCPDRLSYRIWIGLRIAWSTLPKRKTPSKMSGSMQFPTERIDTVPQFQ